MSNGSTYKTVIWGYAFRSAANAIFWQTVVLSLLGNNVPGDRISLAFSVLSITSILVDIPTGIFADRVSYKLTVIISSLFMFAAFGSFLMADKLVVLPFLGYFFMGCSFAFESGAYRFLILDIAEKSNHPNPVPTTARHIQYCQRFGTLVGFGIGGYLVSKNPQYPWIFGISMILLNLITLSMIKNGHQHREKRDFAAIIQTARTVFKPHIAMIFAPVVLLVVAEGLREGSDGILFSPYMSKILGGSQYLGILPLIIIPIRILGTKWTKRISDGFASTGSLLTYFLISFCILSFGLFPTKYIVLPAVALTVLLFSFHMVWIDVWQIKLVDDAKLPRATTLSLLSTTKSAVTMLAAWAVAALDLLKEPYTQAYRHLGVSLAIATGAASLLFYLCRKIQLATNMPQNNNFR